MAGGHARAVVPQYAKIAADLRNKIKDGTYGPGALLPSRNEITGMYGVSAITARDALSVLSHEGDAQAVRGRGHIVRRKRSRLTVPARLYQAADHDPRAALRLHRLDIYQETPPDNIALPLETGADELAWVRRPVWTAAPDRQPTQIHGNRLPALDGGAEHALRCVDPATPWPAAVQLATGRHIPPVVHHAPAPAATP